MYGNMNGNILLDKQTKNRHTRSEKVSTTGFEPASNRIASKIILVILDFECQTGALPLSYMYADWYGTELHFSDNIHTSPLIYNNI